MGAIWLFQFWGFFSPLIEYILFTTTITTTTNTTTNNNDYHYYHYTFAIL